jgi:hypothetical protein
MFLVDVDMGSMEYSAVSQPRPEFLRKGGTPASSEAVQITFVFPSSIRIDPPGCRRKFLVIFTSLISFQLRSFALTITPRCESIL